MHASTAVCYVLPLIKSSTKWHFSRILYLDLTVEPLHRQTQAVFDGNFFTVVGRLCQLSYALNTHTPGPLHQQFLTALLLKPICVDCRGYSVLSSYTYQHNRTSHICSFIHYVHTSGIFFGTNVLLKV